MSASLRFMTLARFKLAAYSLGENRSVQLSYRVNSSSTAFTRGTRNVLSSTIINQKFKETLCSRL